MIDNSNYQNKDLVAIFGFRKHMNEDGTPSRDDRKYIENNLYLFKDYQFKIVYQRGRLSPRYENKSGTWKIENEQLVLTVEEQEYEDIGGNKVHEKYRQRIVFIQNNNSIAKPGNKDLWRNQQGIGARGLFDNYK